jgi:hypothetical protein
MMKYADTQRDLPIMLSLYALRAKNAHCLGFEVRGSASIFRYFKMSPRWQVESATSEWLLYICLLTGCCGFDPPSHTGSCTFRKTYHFNVLLVREPFEKFVDWRQCAAVMLLCLPLHKSGALPSLHELFKNGPRSCSAIIQMVYLKRP